MITLGLTGAIAAGKSEVARLLHARGAFLLDADRVAQDTYAPGGPAYDAVVPAPARLKQLTEIVWPPTTESLAAIIRRQAEAGTRVLVLEAAVLLQAGWDRLVDEGWLRPAPPPPPPPPPASASSAPVASRPTRSRPASPPAPRPTPPAPASSSTTT